MPFKDSPEGTTHFYGDSCQPPHGSLKEKRLEEFDKAFPNSIITGSDSDSLYDARLDITRFLSDSIDMAYEEGKKDHECIRHECALYIKHCKENHIPHCSRCFAKCPECNKSLT